MKKTTLSGLLIFILALFTIVGCGENNDDETQPIQPTTATLKIMSQGTSTQIGGINVSVALPAGVTVKAIADGDKLVTESGVVVVSGITAAAGTNTLATATYTAATPTAPGTVMVQVANADGFGTGEFVTINCDIAAGNNPKATDFTVTLVQAVDINGASIGLTVGYTAAIQ